MRFSAGVYAVTGAGSGIGEAAAKKLASEGGSVIVADFVEEGGRRLVMEIEAAGGTAAFLGMDVADESDADGLVRFALEMFGRLDGAVNNAGVVIVDTASGAGLKSAPGQGAYVAAKHGVIGLTEQAAIEYVNDGVRVNAVAPGLVATPQFRSYPEDAQRMYSAMQPGGRPAEPDEVAKAMAWLLSDEASFVSGERMLVDAAQSQK